MSSRAYMNLHGCSLKNLEKHKKNVNRKIKSNHIELLDENNLTTIHVEEYIRNILYIYKHSNATRDQL